MPPAPTKIRRRADLQKTTKQLPLLRNSEKGAYQNCRFAWHLSYGLGKQAKIAIPAFRFGTLIHQSLAEWYIPGLKRGVLPHITFEKKYEEQLKQLSSFGFRDDDGEWHNAGEVGVAILKNYLAEYGNDEEWEVLATEQPFRVLVNHPTTGEPWFYYAGVMDGVWRHRPTKKIWIPDHKTTAGIGNSTGSHLRMDDQASGYWTYGAEWVYANGLLDRKLKIAGMMYNYISKVVPDERPRDAQGRALNQDGSVSKKQPAPRFRRIPIFRDEADRTSFKARVLDAYAEMEAERAKVKETGELPRKSPSQFSCPHCWAYDICEMHEVQQDWKLMLKATTQPWEPYEEHEIYIGETR